MRQPSLPGLPERRYLGVGTCYRCHVASSCGKSGMCNRCRTTSMLERRRRNPIHTKASKKRQKERRRRKVIAKLGGKCTCCGEARWTMLQVDHIHNDGYLEPYANRHHNTERKVLNDPDALSKYQILCSNCNGSKARNNFICEHKTERRVDRFVRFVARLDQSLENYPENLAGI